MMKIFCHRCGAGDQEPGSYCRGCGEFLLDPAGRSLLIARLLGGSTPTAQINVNIALDLLTVFACFLLLGFLNGHYDALRERTGEQTPSVIYLVYGFLLAIAAWQFLSLVIGVRLKSKLGRKSSAMSDAGPTEGSFSAVPTRELLPQSKAFETSPLSVTEEPTRMLDHAKRK